MTAVLLSLACLLLLAIQGYSCVRRRTSLRGTARWALRRIGYAIRPYDMLTDARRWAWQRRARCGWSSASARTVHPHTAGTTAETTTTATGGSPSPDSDAPDVDPMYECPDCGFHSCLCGDGVQHNPCSGRSRLRGQFGMCDYPEER